MLLSQRKFVDGRPPIGPEGACGKTERPGCVAYLADPVAVGGPAALFQQKRAIDAYRLAEGLDIDRWFIDSGRHFAGQKIGCAMTRLIGAVRCGSVDTIVVEHASRLAEDYAEALHLAAWFASKDVRLHEAREGLTFLDEKSAAVFHASRDPASARLSAAAVLQC